MKQLLIIITSLAVVDIIKFILKRTITKYNNYKKFRLIGSKIVITKCSIDIAWYKDEIGETFTIKNVLPGEYIINERNVMYGNAVLAKDCKLIKKTESE